jgi:hypothetical protein
MTTHTLKLVYDGLGATHHKMAPSLEKQITAGAQEFLGAHAYFFTEGQIPASIQDHTKRFQIVSVRARLRPWSETNRLSVSKA